MESPGIPSGCGIVQSYLIYPRACCSPFLWIFLSLLYMFSNHPAIQSCTGSSMDLFICVIAYLVTIVIVIYNLIAISNLSPCSVSSLRIAF